MASVSALSLTRQAVSSVAPRAAAMVPILSKASFRGAVFPLVPRRTFSRPPPLHQAHAARATASTPLEQPHEAKQEHQQGEKQVQGQQQQQQQGGGVMARPGREAAISPFTFDLAPWFSFRGERDMLDLMDELMFTPSRFFRSHMRDAMREVMRPIKELEQWAEAQPTVDVVEEEGAYKFKVDLPGLSKDDVKVQVDTDRRVLSIVGRKEEEGEGEGAPRHSWAQFSFRFRLPRDAKIDGVNAEVKENILVVQAPKLPEEAKKEKVLDVAIQ